jgi:phosphoglycolate phosphatase
MPPPPFLFDLDGTLVDSLEDIRSSANHVRALAGLPPVDRAAAAALVGDGAYALLERALRGNPRGLVVEEVFGAWLEHHERECTRAVRPYDGAFEWLAARQREGVPLAVVTNKPERIARRVLEHVGFAGLFDVVIGGDTTAEKKPSPLPLREALRRLGLDGAGGTMVGDGQQDLRAGRAAGLATIGVLFGFDPETVRRSGLADGYWIRFGVPAPAGR